MAAVTNPKARKEFKCGKCGATIPVGEQYFRAQRRFAATLIRCAKCGRPRQSELTTSDKLSRVYAASEQIDDIQTSASLEDVKTELDSIADEIEEVAQEYEEGADNQEEHFQGGSSQIEESREKAENLNSWAEEVRSAAENLPDEDDLKQQAKDETESDTVPEPGERDLEQEADEDAKFTELKENAIEEAKEAANNCPL